MSIVLAIDPGTTESGWVLFDDVERKVMRGERSTNRHLVDLVASLPYDKLAVEMVASYGMAVGKETFETVLWAGRFIQASHMPDDAALVYRKDVKLYLCGSTQAKDPNVRQALLDLFGPVGTKKAPGPLYGISGHLWSALAVAATFCSVKRISASVAGAIEFEPEQGVQMRGTTP